MSPENPRIRRVTGNERSENIAEKEIAEEEILEICKNMRYIFTLDMLEYLVKRGL